MLKNPPLTKYNINIVCIQMSTRVHIALAMHPIFFKSLHMLTDSAVQSTVKGEARA